MIITLNYIEEQRTSTSNKQQRTTVEIYILYKILTGYLFIKRIMGGSSYHVLEVDKLVFRLSLKLHLQSSISFSSINQIVYIIFLNSKLSKMPVFFHARHKKPFNQQKLWNTNIEIFYERI